MQKQIAQKFIQYYYSEYKTTLLDFITQYFQIINTQQQFSEQPQTEQPQTEQPTLQPNTQKKQDNIKQFIQTYQNITTQFNTTPGKYIRPFLSFSAYYFLNKQLFAKHFTRINLQQDTKILNKILNNSQKEYLAKAPTYLIIGAYLELIHNHLLIHDDFMDKSTKRRDSSTSWYAYYKKYKIKHTAYSLGVLSGNTTLLSAFNLLGVSKNISTKSIQAIITYTYKIIEKVIQGQVADILIQKVPIQNVSINDIQFINENKTAIYTNIFPVKVVYKLFNQTCEPACNLILKQLGEIFQIIDDLKDLTKSGKQQYLDIIDKKRTLIALYAYQNADKKTKQLLEKFYNTGYRHNPKEIAKIILKFGLTDTKNHVTQLQNSINEKYKLIPSTPLKSEHYIISIQNHLITAYYNKILKQLA